MTEERYEILVAMAGQGGFGRIDKATDTTLGRDVAIKTLDPLFKAKPEQKDVQRFHREAKSLAQLSHPNIPAIYDVQFDPDNDHFRIIFEWIDGQTIRHRLQEQGVLSLDEARIVFTQVCSALEHAHQINLIHRDIKPSNIIMAKSGSACYLVDFGIALQTDDLTRITDTTRIGTAGYMPPEQEHGEEVTPASDVYAVGIVLYESLTGSRPAVGSYKSLTLHNESYPPGLDDLVRSALEEDPALRPQTADAFLRKMLGALRPHSTFTSTLADGSLHEIQLALANMSPTDFAALPPGQRILLATRLQDLATVDDERLRRAVAALLVELVRLGHVSNVPDYRAVVRYAFEYGYEQRYGETWIGNPPLRASLNDVALICDAQSHAIIAEMADSRARAELLETPRGWYYHDIRILLSTLLINPACSETVGAMLGEALSHVNAATH